MSFMTPVEMWDRIERLEKRVRRLEEVSPLRCDEKCADLVCKKPIAHVGDCHFGPVHSVMVNELTDKGKP
jgi:hypothetical protein